MNGKNLDILSQSVTEKTIELIEKISNAKANKVRLDDGQVFYRGESHILKIIGDEPGIFSSEIARRFGVTRAVIHKTLNKLEERGLVKKEEDEEDRKRYKLFLTEEGRRSSALLARRQSVVASAFFSCVSEMTEAELRAVINFLDSSNKVLDHMQ